MNVPFSPPDISQAEIDEVCDALRSGWITTGPRTKELERQVAARCGTPKAVCLNSATAALECALRLLGVGPGDEVITSAYTYTASCSVICHVGATPVLVDVTSDSYQMDLDALAAAITPRTKVIIPVDIAGVVCDYDGIMAVCEAKKELFTPANERQALWDRVILLADCAHSFGASRKGIAAGAWADFSAFSFHAVKNLTTAEGGALTWKAHEGLDDELVYKELMLMSLHGQSKDALAKTKLGAWEYDILYPAYKCNMTDVHAAIGLAQLRRYDAMLARRREILDAYQAGINAPVEFLQHDGDDFASSRHLCLVQLVGKDMGFRNALIIRMAAYGVATNVHYKPLPLLTAYRDLGFDIADYPRAYERFCREITLPLHTNLTDEQVAYVVRVFNQAYHEVEFGMAMQLPLEED
ncbi:MAG: DegT/DnrJ/EryC1/StrS family aminotransferase [Coriobacteriales bacterium]|nr:DegT/DnrJ/EryC1/StrS family aminotransferase [Coriobacteriales bacterium]